MELNNFTCFTLRTDALLFLLNVFADTLVVKAPHQTERSIKLVEQLDYSRNLDFSFADRWLIFAKLFIHDVAVPHSKISIWWHFVIVFAHTLVVKAPHQTETSAKLVENLDDS